MEMTLRAFHRVEADESHTAAVEITGLPSLEWSRHMAHWLHDLIKERAHEIGCGLASDRLRQDFGLHRLGNGCPSVDLGGGARLRQRARRAHAL